MANTVKPFAGDSMHASHNLAHSHDATMMRGRALRWCLVVGCCFLSLLFLSSTVEVSGAPASSSVAVPVSQPIVGQSLRDAAKLKANAAVETTGDGRDGTIGVQPLAQRPAAVSAARTDSAAAAANAGSTTRASAQRSSSSGSTPSSETWRSPVDLFSSANKLGARTSAQPVSAAAAAAAAGEPAAAGLHAASPAAAVVDVPSLEARLPPALKLDAHLPPSVVPRHVFVNWHSAELPEGMRAALSQMKALNPAFQFRFFDANDMRNYIAAYAPPRVLSAFTTLLPQAYRADLFRYFALHREGGMW